VVPQSRVDLVRQRAQGVAVRLAHDIDATRPAMVKREVPGGLERLPSTVLGRVGGGDIPIDPMVEGGTKTFEKTFQFDVELTVPLEPFLVGGRAYVRFDHGTEPVAFQIYRSARQLLLRRLNV
jgi:putative peptide zinc metalloprotease protein